MISIDQVENLLERAAERGVQKWIEREQSRTLTVPQYKAYSLYGRGRVKGWVEAGKIAPMSSGGGKTSPKRYNAAELRALNNANHLVARKQEYV